MPLLATMVIYVLVGAMFMRWFAGAMAWKFARTERRREPDGFQWAGGIMCALPMLALWPLGVMWLIASRWAIADEKLERMERELREQDRQLREAERILAEELGR